MKELAVVITAFKIDSRLIETIDIFNNQRIPKNWKIKIYIGVDGCDDSASILNKNNVSYYFSKENVGTYKLFNSIMLEAKKEGYDALLRFDWDDVPLDCFLYNGLKCLEKFDFVRASFIKTNENLKLLENNKTYLAYGIFFITNKLMSKVGGFNEYRIECDNDLIERLKDIGYVSVNLNNLFTKMKIFGLRHVFSNKYPIFYRRMRKESLSSDPNVGHGTEYRTKIKYELEEKRNSGNSQIIDLPKTQLTFIKNV